MYEHQLKSKKPQEHLDAADQLFSVAVSRVRQPIESLFAQIEQRSDIEYASLVRSYTGLINSTHLETDSL